jgi:hypothetical protein
VEISPRLTLMCCLGASASLVPTADQRALDCRLLEMQAHSKAELVNFVRSARCGLEEAPFVLGHRLVLTGHTEAAVVNGNDVWCSEEFSGQSCLFRFEGTRQRAWRQCGKHSAGPEETIP